MKEKIHQLELRVAELHAAQSAAIVDLLAAPVKTPALRAAVCGAAAALDAVRDELHVAYAARKIAKDFEAEMMKLAEVK